MIRALILAILATVPGPATSLLVDENHEHDWLPVWAKGDTEPFGWLDEAWRGELEFAGETYPLVLVRMFFGEADIDSDQLFLVNCEIEQLGIYRFLRLSANDLNELATVTRVTLKEPEDALDEAIINQACSKKIT